MASLVAMSSKPGAPLAPPSGPGGQIDYRLARRRLVDAVRGGRVARLDVCDAHPELLRAARNVGTALGETCPICEDAPVVLVSYLFGPSLPASGRCVTSTAEIDRVAQGARSGPLTCYVVEVCPACGWNHLHRNFLVPHGARRGRAAATRR